MNDHDLNQTVHFLNGTSKRHALDPAFRLLDLRPRLYQRDNGTFTVVLDVEYALQPNGAQPNLERQTTLVDFRHALGSFGKKDGKPPLL